MQSSAELAMNLLQYGMNGAKAIDCFNGLIRIESNTHERTSFNVVVLLHIAHPLHVEI